MEPFIKEACIENLDQALKAQRNGADRIELCEHLDLEGLTPSHNLIKEANRQLKIPLRVMIRPRGGDFIYSASEIKQMIASINFCKEIGVEGVIFGLLTYNKKLDLERIRLLTNIAAPLKVGIHKAIDHTGNPLENLEELLKIPGITSVLTSGGATTALEGKEVIKKMLQISANKLEIIPAGKISETNLYELHAYFGARAYHGKRIVGDL
ncbi:copper homeostasis protein CutC [Gramella jeungdoensis]|uniref:PF03932 family protein CutC n=1 Tax=Gramella jeungdoensis TaxID=708091 RepID=A0ABT0Z6F4_9FLAO|nr:copper homeostasis protein CutC [Gramella jeungdoensis]MCM8570374.1 copper homeostasis protein CutC [Gramella jeungdoensis]